MGTEALREEFRKRMEAGESLVGLDQVPALKALSNSTRANMANDGRIPAIRNGRRFLTLVSLANEALLGGLVDPKSPKAIVERSSHGSQDAQALAQLKAMGYKPPVKK